MHIFMSRENLSLDNGDMMTFVIKAIMASRGKVFIHIPKTRPALKERIESELYGISNVKIIFENPKQVWFFRRWNRYSYRVFTVVMWNHGNIQVGRGETFNSDDVILSDFERLL